MNYRLRSGPAAGFVLSMSSPASHSMQSTCSTPSRRAICATAEPEWRVLTVPDCYLRLSLTLASGQSFLWREIGTFSFARSYTGEVREWAGPIRDQLFILRQAHPQPPESATDPVWYRVINSCTTKDETDSHQILMDYFRASIDHTQLMGTFCEADGVFKNIFPYYKGLRTIRQDPEPTLFSFICSSNNNIKRITMLVSFLASRYGKELGTHNGQKIHAFPSTEVLAAEANEEDLREAGFGYRAKFIPATAIALTKMASSQGLNVAEMLLSWRNLERKEVSDRLVQFTGIGRKVAGCIALMSLDQHGEIPVDTHVWQIAKRYMPGLDGKSLTDRVYDRIGDFFRERFGEDVAGLAHNVLFIAELSDFKNLVPDTGKQSEKGNRKTKLKAVSVKAGTRVTKLRNNSKVEGGSRKARGSNGVKKTTKRAQRKTEKTGRYEDNW